MRAERRSAGGSGCGGNHDRSRHRGPERPRAPPASPPWALIPPSARLPPASRSAPAGPRPQAAWSPAGAAPLPCNLTLQACLSSTPSTPAPCSSAQGPHSHALWTITPSLPGGRWPLHLFTASSGLSSATAGPAGFPVPACPGPSQLSRPPSSHFPPGNSESLLWKEPEGLSGPEASPGASADHSGPSHHPRLPRLSSRGKGVVVSGRCPPCVGLAVRQPSAWSVVFSVPDVAGHDLPNVSESSVLKK